MDPRAERVSRATIRDVSRVAEVSIKTVSRVLNHENYVRAETRAHVERVIAELRFHPSSAARALAGARFHQIAIVCDNPSPWYVYELQYGTRLRCQQDRVRMLAQPYDRGSPTLLEDIVSLLDQVHPDGLVLTPPVCDEEPVLEELLRRGVPFVRVQPGTRTGLTSSAFIDNERAAYEMTCHLLELGHARIGCIAGDPGYAASGHRLNGYRRALAEAGFAPDPELTQPGWFDFASGSAAAEVLLGLALPPTAIFACNDEMAAGTMATAHRLGLSMPGALSVAGFDDAASASLVWPALTTIRQPVRTLAHTAADLLLAPPPSAEHRQVAHALIVRDSTGPPLTKT